MFITKISFDLFLILCTIYLTTCVNNLCTNLFVTSTHLTLNIHTILEHLVTCRHCRLSYTHPQLLHITYNNNILDFVSIINIFKNSNFKYLCPNYFHNYLLFFVHIPHFFLLILKTKGGN